MIPSHQNVDLKLIAYFKKCKKCNSRKIITDFHWNCHTDLKYKKIYCYWTSICKVCDNERRGKLYHLIEKNGLRKTEEWYKKNKEQCQRYYWKNVEVLGKKWNEATKRSKLKHGKKWAAHSREYYRLHSVKILERGKEYNKLNRPKIRERIGIKRKQNRLKYNIKEYISKCLKGNKAGRHWEDLVGYNLSDLKAHLEKQFKPGMTWNNYGTWHLDHRKPQSSFSFLYPEDSEFLECWGLDNLQPLWASENQSKGAKL